MLQPTGADPVKVIAPMRSSSTIALPDLRARAADDLQPVLGEPRVVEDLSQLDRGDRGLAGGLQDDGVSGSDRGTELVPDQVEREVEGTDRADHAVGDADHDAELAALTGRAGLHRDRMAGEGPGGDGRELHGRDAALGLGPACLHRLARLSGDRHRQVVLALGDQVGGAIEHRGALMRREAAGVKAARAASTALPTSAASPLGTRPTTVPS